MYDEDAPKIKPERHYKKYFIYSLRTDGTQGLYLGNVYAYSAREALEEAQYAFKKAFPHGVVVVDGDMN